MSVCNSTGALELSVFLSVFFVFVFQIKNIYLEETNARDLPLFLFFYIIPTVNGPLSFQPMWHLGLISIFLEGIAVSKYYLFNTKEVFKY